MYGYDPNSPMLSTLIHALVNLAAVGDRVVKRWDIFLRLMRPRLAASDKPADIELLKAIMCALEDRPQ